MNNKLNQFVDFLVGEDVEFPFFKDGQQVPYPHGFDEMHEAKREKELKIIRSNQ